MNVVAAVVATTWLLLGLVWLLPFVFICAVIARLFAGHVIAKRVHELVLGCGIYYWMRLLGFWKLEIRGKVPPGGPFVVIANHASYLDHGLLSFVPIRKKRTDKSKVFGWTQWVVKDVAVDLSSPETRKKSVEQCSEVLRSGNSIVIYPEGTRSKIAPEMIPFKQGAFRIAKEANVPILPIALTNAHKGTAHGLIAGYANLVITIGEPFTVGEDIEASMKKARDWIEANIIKDKPKSH